MVDTRLSDTRAGGAVPATQPVFYYDLGNPHCYLIAEQIMSALTVVPEWEPVLELHIRAASRELDRRGLERQAAALSLQPLRWPSRWPPDTRVAMLTATYAKRVGRGVAFSLAAFRQSFAAGRDLGDLDTMLIAAAACEMHPTAVLKGIKLRSVEDALQAAGARARAARVASLPAIHVDGQTFEGQEALRGAANALQERR